MADREWGAGDKSKWRNIGEVIIGPNPEYERSHPLFMGEHPHSTSENSEYVHFDSIDEPVGFDGYRVLIDINIRSHNYLKSSYFSGDEVRKGGLCEIFFNRVKVYEFFHRSPLWAMQRATHLISKIEEHPLEYWKPGVEQKLVGRPMFYREIPCFITRVIVDQGCLILTRRDGKLWPAPIYQPDGDQEEEVKVDIIDETSNLWYWDHEKNDSRGISAGVADLSNLPRSGPILGAGLHNPEAERRSGGSSGEGGENDARRAVDPDSGEKGSTSS